MATIQGIDDLINFNKKVITKEKVDTLCRAIALASKELAYQYAPEDTGKMETMIQVYRIADGSYELACYVPYAIYNEYGTYYMPVGTEQSPLPVTSTSGKRAYRPFLRPAIYQTLEQLPDWVKKIIFNAGTEIEEGV